MFYLVLAALALPLLLGVWFLALPTTVPLWIAQLPLAIVDLFWKHELKEMDPRSRQGQFFTPIDQDPNYRDYRIDHMQGLSSQIVPGGRPAPGKVQVIGFVMIALWLAAAFALKSCAVSLAKSTRDSRVQSAAD